MALHDIKVETLKENAILLIGSAKKPALLLRLKIIISLPKKQ